MTRCKKKAPLGPHVCNHADERQRQRTAWRTAVLLMLSNEGGRHAKANNVHGTFTWRGPFQRRTAHLESPSNIFIHRGPGSRHTGLHGSDIGGPAYWRHPRAWDTDWVFHARRGFQTSQSQRGRRARCQTQDQTQHGRKATRNRKHLADGEEPPKASKTNGTFSKNDHRVATLAKKRNMQGKREHVAAAASTLARTSCTQRKPTSANMTIC